jgi:hypothetical protein
MQMQQARGVAEQLVTVPDFDGTHNRDKGKVYQITEMPASQGDDWGTRAALALVRANPELTEVLGTVLKTLCALVAASLNTPLSVIEKLTVLLLLATSLTNFALAKLTNCAPCVAVAAVVANP